MSDSGDNSLSLVESLKRADVESAVLDALEAKLLRAIARGDFTEDSPELWKRLRGEIFEKDQPRERAAGRETNRPRFAAEAE